LIKQPRSFFVIWKFSPKGGTGDLSLAGRINGCTPVFDEYGATKGALVMANGTALKRFCVFFQH